MFFKNKGFVRASQFSCPTCSQLMACPDDTAGQKTICPWCGQKVLIPTPPSQNQIKPQNKTKLGKLEGDMDAAGIPTATFAAIPVEPLPIMEPNRGVTIMVLGIVSCAGCLLAMIGSLLTPIFGIIIAIAALPFGIIAWTMGHEDRKGILEKRLTPDGEPFVRTGLIRGIVGTSVASFLILACSIGTLFCLSLLFHAHVNQHNQRW
jgi:DNA-directed RNA polymerase subunit RPC12/RpoP